MSEEAALYFCREGCRMLFCSKGAVHISVYSDDPARSRHLELEICVVWHRIESCECSPPEQCVVATAERDDVEDQPSLLKLSGDPKTTSNITEPVQRASTPGITPLKVVLVGLILEGSMPIYALYPDKAG